MKLFLPALIGLSVLGCATANKPVYDQAGVVERFPKSYLGSYVELVGTVTDKRPQDLFPPYPGDPLLCDSSGCIYIHDDTEDLNKFLGKKVKVLGFVKVDTFNFPYVDVIKIEPLGR